MNKLIEFLELCKSKFLENEFESRLKNCETQKEKDNVVEDYNEIHEQLSILIRITKNI